METWYRADISLNKIEEVQIEFETEKTITSNGNKFRKESQFHKYCKTKDEAKQFLISYLQSKIKYHNDVLNFYESKLQIAKQF